MEEEFEKIGQEMNATKKDYFPKFELPYFEDSDDVSFNVLGDILMDNMHIKCYHDNLYLWKSGRYEPDEKTLELKMLEMCPSLTRSKRKEVLDYIKLKSFIDEQNLNSNLISFKNGFYNLAAKELLPHDPLVFLLNQVHASFNPNVEVNEYIEKFLNDITCNNPERKQAILELTGYCMTNSVWLGKACVFYGPSAENGKSVLIKLIINLIGEENTSHISLPKLQDRFSPADLVDKLLNTTSELPKTDLKSVDIFKSVVTGDRMAVDRKFKKIITIKPYAKHIFATNSLPAVADDTNGYFRRLNIILFERKFTIEEQNNFIEEKLFTQNALDYFAKISLEAYLKLVDEGRRDFANYEESNKLIAAYKADNNSVLLFLESDDVKEAFSEEKRVKKTSFYQMYKDWCINNNYTSEKSKVFHQKVIETKNFVLKFYDGYENYQKR